MKGFVMEISSKELDMLAVYSCRYTIGRMTYAVNDTVDFLIKHWDELSDNAKKVIIGDIKSAPSLGMEMDEANWQKVLEL